MGKDNDVYKLH